jgi:hypothetical protein
VDAVLEALGAGREHLSSQDTLLALRDIVVATAVLKLATDEVSHLRATYVAKLIQEKKLSLKKVANILGVSKARAGQLNEVGKRLLQQT